MAVCGNVFTESKYVGKILFFRTRLICLQTNVQVGIPFRNDKIGNLLDASSPKLTSFSLILLIFIDRPIYCFNRTHWLCGKLKSFNALLTSIPFQCVDLISTKEIFNAILNFVLKVLYSLKISAKKKKKPPPPPNQTCLL